MKKLFSLLLVLAMLLSLAACGGKSEVQEQAPAETDVSVVNIGATSALGTLNPLMMDGTWINVYAMGLEFLPLVSLNDNLEFEYMLADSITTEDNLTYTIRLKEEAFWSDGQPITAHDLAYTMTRIASPLVMNYAMRFTAVVGTDDDTGWVAEGTELLEGLKVIDEKTMTVTFKYEINKTSFLNGYAQYILTLPKHVLETIPEAELASSQWFDAPTVVSGPYQVVDYDADHYISYVANENYWQGAPEIKNCNIRIVDPSQLLSGLQSGEIDIVPPLLGAIPLEDYPSVRELERVSSDFGVAIATETIFLNTESIPDIRVRQAMLYALDRETIVNGLLSGGAELMDGFCVPDGPYSSNLEPISYDPDKAQQLLSEAGWDGSESYTLYIDAGDKTLINACTLCQAYWKAVGINVELVTVDLDSLMAQAGDAETDLLAVQYTYPVVDPSWDIDWVLSAWCHLYPEGAADALNTIWTSNEESILLENYAWLDRMVQEQVPLICLYANGPLGAVSNDLENAQATMYGALNNIHEWSWAE